MCERPVCNIIDERGIQFQVLGTKTSCNLDFENRYESSSHVSLSSLMSGRIHKRGCISNICKLYLTFVNYIQAHTVQSQLHCRFALCCNRRRKKKSLNPRLPQTSTETRNGSARGSPGARRASRGRVPGGSSPNRTR